VSVIYSKCSQGVGPIQPSREALPPVFISSICFLTSSTAAVPARTTIWSSSSMFSFHCPEQPIYDLLLVVYLRFEHRIMARLVDDRDVCARLYQCLHALKMTIQSSPVEGSVSGFVYSVDEFWCWFVSTHREEQLDYVCHAVRYML
jgi:hypothetical protein